MSTTIYISDEEAGIIAAALLILRDNYSSGDASAPSAFRARRHTIIEGLHGSFDYAATTEQPHPIRVLTGAGFNGNDAA